jgi:hypothetical protein
VTFTPEQIETFRSIGLSIDRAGRIWHQGAEVTHPRLRRALLRWLDVRDDGRDIIRLDDTRYAYVDVEDAHLRATSARWEGDRVWLHLDDDSEEELDYATLALADDGALTCRVRGGGLRCRLGTAAHVAVAERIVESSAGFALQAAGILWPIATLPARVEITQPL